MKNNRKNQNMSILASVRGFFKSRPLLGMINNCTTPSSMSFFSVVITTLLNSLFFFLFSAKVSRVLKV